jgi:hypothetical protein
MDAGQADLDVLARLEPVEADHVLGEAHDLDRLAHVADQTLSLRAERAGSRMTWHASGMVMN